MIYVFTSVKAEDTIIPDEAIRFRVIANSNTIYDQNIKIQLKNVVQNKIFELTKGTEEWDLAGKLRAKDRYVCRVIVRGKTTADGQDDETKPEFWEFGTKIHGYFFDQIKLGEAGNFLSLKDEGRDYIEVLVNY